MQTHGERSVLTKKVKIYQCKIRQYVRGYNMGSKTENLVFQILINGILGNTFFKRLRITSLY